VRRLLVLTAVGSALGSLIPIAAESFTYGKLVAGQVQTALVYGGGRPGALSMMAGLNFRLAKTLQKQLFHSPSLRISTAPIIMN